MNKTAAKHRHHWSRARVTLPRQTWGAFLCVIDRWFVMTEATSTTTSERYSASSKTI